MKNNDLFDSFQTQLALLAPENASFSIALSGGLDSIVLLHLFSRLKNNEVIAHHVHHGLSENADSWALFCQKIANQLNLECAVTNVVLDKKNRTSLEALARDKRYEALKVDLTENSYLVTAHHQDDQLETVLLALKRGAGLTGLQGIVAKQTLNTGYLIRPLLDCSREQLEAYAAAFELTWIEDESNDDQCFDRNFIRHRITPLLKERWPSITKTVARSASHCHNQQLLINEITEADFRCCVLPNQALNIEVLGALSETRINNVLRYWFKQSSLNYPSTKQLMAIWQSIALAKIDAEPQLLLQGKAVCRYQSALYLIDCNQKINELKKMVWQGEKQLVLGAGLITLKFDVSDHFLNESHCVEICFRKDLPADLKCQPVGRNKSRSIKKLLHEYQVPPWLRDSVVFVLIDGCVVEAVGKWKCETASSKQFHTSFV